MQKEFLPRYYPQDQQEEPSFHERTIAVHTQKNSNLQVQVWNTNNLKHLELATHGHSVEVGPCAEEQDSNSPFLPNHSPPPPRDVFCGLIPKQSSTKTIYVD